VLPVLSGTAQRPAYQEASCDKQYVASFSVKKATLGAVGEGVDGLRRLGRILFSANWVELANRPE